MACSPNGHKKENGACISRQQPAPISILPCSQKTRNGPLAISPGGHVNITGRFFVLCEPGVCPASCTVPTAFCRAVRRFVVKCVGLCVVQCSCGVDYPLPPFIHLPTCPLTHLHIYPFIHLHTYTLLVRYTESTAPAVSYPPPLLVLAGLFPIPERTYLTSLFVLAVLS
jgi:hypothetical protein